MKISINYILLSIVLLFSLSQVGCVSETAAAPISMVIAKSELSSGYYKVHAGDTLYSIAWAYNLDYRKLARYNRLSNNAILNVGEVIRLNDSVKRLRRGGYKKKASVFYSNVNKKDQNKVHNISSSQLVSPTRWIWPTKGKVIETFSRSASGNKGLNIAGKYGQPVHSSAKGVIVYCGVGVRGYGSLIIVKHSRDFLSAYANNSVILVKLGQRVKAGQLIAKMGRTNAGSALLHFEIRYDGRPVNPAKYLG